MIVYLSTAAHQYTVRTLLEHRPTSLDGRFIILNYDEFLSWRRLPVAHYIFTDFDRLSPASRNLVLQRVDLLRTCLPKGRQILNHPAHTLGRLPLLSTLEAAGINDYRARRVSQGFDELKFPVFVRFENDHAGAQTPLVTSPAALSQALQLLRDTGAAVEDCLVTEFIDVRNQAGLFEKFSVFRVGEVFFAAEHSVNRDWICKGTADEFWSAEWGEKELQFQASNPHMALLKPVFELAGIDYGRVDYAFSQGRLQVFEINTNPMLDVAVTTDPLRKMAQQHFIEQYVLALTSLSGDGQRLETVSVPGHVMNDQVDGGSGLRTRIRSGLRATGLLHHECRVFRWAHRLRGEPRLYS